MSDRRKTKSGSIKPPPTAVLRPRDAATLVIVDRSRKTPRVLMGRRRPDQVFLPDTFVFPGGRVDPADRTMARHHPLSPRDAHLLKTAMRGRPSDARAAALTLAAVRETFEETGFVIGAPVAGDAREAPGCWAEFLAEGFHPRVEGLSFFARAITPPGRPRRYDTRFFMADAALIARHAERTDGELLDIDWFTLDQARTLKVASITTHVIEDITALIARPDHSASPASIPFYSHRYGRFERRLLPLPTAGR